MEKLIKLENTKALKIILVIFYAVVIVGIIVSNEWIILASTILMIISVMVAYFKQR